MSEDKTFKELVSKELKNQANEQEVAQLELNPEKWLSELIALKLSCEAQMIASKARSFQNHSRWVTKEITQAEYLKGVDKEKKWRCDSALFLQQVETRIRRVKYGL